MTSRQIGRFKVSQVMVEKEPDNVATVFALLKVVPVCVSHNWAAGVFDYTAICERFREIGEGCEAPLYTLNVSCDSLGNPSVVVVEEREGGE